MEIVSGLRHQTLPTIKHQQRTTQLAAADFQRKPVQADNRRDDRQSQPETALRVTALGAIEALKHRLTFGQRYAGAGVEYFDSCMPSVIHST